MSSGLKIRTLEATNVGVVSHFRMIVKEGVNEIAGPNGCGKSTLADIPMILLGGKKYLGDLPLKQGESGGNAVMEVEDWRMELILKEGSNPRWKITQDGKRRTQGDVKEFFSAIAFDPLAFSRMTAAEQVDMARTMAGAEWCDEIDAAKEKLEGLEQERLFAGRKVKDLGTPEAVGKVVPVNVKALADERQAIGEHNAAQDKRQVSFVRAREARQVADGNILRAKADLAAAEAAFEDAERFLQSLPTPCDIQDASAVNAQIEAADETNRKASLYAKYVDDKKQLGVAVSDHKASDIAVDAQRDAISVLMSEVKLPVEGMTFDDGHLFIDRICNDR